MILENIDIDIDIDMVILENIDIDKAILQNIDIDKISNRFKFGISNRAKLKGEGLDNHSPAIIFPSIHNFNLYMSIHPLL